MTQMHVKWVKKRNGESRKGEELDLAYRAEVCTFRWEYVTMMSSRIAITLRLLHAKWPLQKLAIWCNVNRVLQHSLEDIIGKNCQRFRFRGFKFRYFHVCGGVSRKKWYRRNGRNLIPLVKTRHQTAMMPLARDALSSPSGNNEWTCYAAVTHFLFLQRRPLQILLSVFIHQCSKESFC
jgi:hypothetical protein